MVVSNKMQCCEVIVAGSPLFVWFSVHGCWVALRERVEIVRFWLRQCCARSVFLRVEHMVLFLFPIRFGNGDVLGYAVA